MSTFDTVKEYDQKHQKKQLERPQAVNEATGHHQTTSKKFPGYSMDSQNLNKNVCISKIDHVDDKGLDFSALNMSNAAQSENHLDIFGKQVKRELSQQQKSGPKQFQNFKQPQSNSLESTKNIKQQVNPSIPQQVFKDNKLLPQFIQLKSKLSLNNNAQTSGPQQHKQLLVLNQRNINCQQKDPKDSSSGFNATQTSLKRKIEKTKNIYSQFQTRDDKVTNYNDISVKGQRSRMVPSSTFNKSRNSNFSVNSKDSRKDIKNESTDILVSTYGISQSQQAHYPAGSIQKQANRKYNDSFQQSQKNSYNNTKTSFGLNKQPENQQQMEIRGNNLATTQNRMQNSKGLQNMGKNISGITPQKFQSQSQQQIQLSKHIPINKTKDKTSNMKPKDKNETSHSGFLDEENFYQQEQKNVGQHSQVMIKNKNNEDSLNMTQNFKDWNKKQDTKSAVNITLKADLKNRNQVTNSTQKFMTSATTTHMIKRAAKQDRVNESELPQINVKNNKSEENLWEKGDRRNKSNNDKIISRTKEDFMFEQFSSRNNIINTSASKGSLKNVEQEQENQTVYINNNNNSMLEFQRSQLRNNNSFDNKIQNDSMNYSQKKKIKNADSKQQQEIVKMNSQNSMDQNSRSEINQLSVERQGLNNFYKKSMENNGATTVVGTKQKHHGIQLAPLHPTRENFGQGPGTANTTGNPNRNVYRQHTSEFQGTALQYKLSSQQCNSEILQHQISNHNLQQKQQYYNNFYEAQHMSQPGINFKNPMGEDSFDYLFNPHFEKLDDLDPQEDVNFLHHAPVIRSQKSQGTHRQNYRVTNMMQYQQLNDNNSFSEFYDLQSSNIINDNNSQLNELNVNIKANLSQNSDNGQVRSIPTKKNEMFQVKNIISTEDRQNPFSGPKLHLFKKGQSKSSQTKSRKIKTSDNHNRVIEMNSQQNMLFSQQDATSNHHLYYPQRQQLSEGGPTHLNRNNLQTQTKVSKTKNSHINISEILKENRKNGVLVNQIQMNLDGLQQENSRSQQNSQEVRSQSSFEIGHGTPDNNCGDLQQPLLDYDQVYRVEQRAKYSLENDVNKSDCNLQKSKERLNDMQAFETHSQQYTTHMNTLIKEKEKMALHLQYSNTNKNGFNKETRLSSSYLLPSPMPNESRQTESKLTNINIQNSQQPHNLMQIKQDNSNESIQNSVMRSQQESSSTRPNTTNQVGSHIYIVNSTSDAQGQVVQKQQIQNFQHPKVGKNSKYPDVFRKNTTQSSSKNGSLLMHHGSTQIMMEGRDSSVILDNSNVFANTVDVMPQNESMQSNHFEKARVKKELHPQQTGDFPSPTEIRQYHNEYKQEQLIEANDYAEQQPLPKFSNIQAAQMKGVVNLNDLMNNEKFKSLMNEERGDRLLDRQNSENFNKKFHTPQRNEIIANQRNQNVQSASAPMRNFKSRQGLRPINGEKVGMSHGNKRMSENVHHSGQRTFPTANLFDEGSKSIKIEDCKREFSRCSDVINQDQSGSQLPSIHHKNSTKQLHMTKNSSNYQLPQDNLVKAVPLKKNPKLQTIEAPSSVQFKVSDNSNLQVFTPKQHKSPTMVAVFEIDKKLNEESNKLMSQNQSQGTTSKKEKSEDTKIIIKDQKNTKDDQCFIEKDSMRETNQNKFHSVAQTPCFAETPYTTDHFKGYKIQPEHKDKAMQNNQASRQSRESLNLNAYKDEEEKADHNSNESHKMIDNDSYSQTNELEINDLQESQRKKQ